MGGTEDVLWHPEAIADAEHALAWYRERSEIAAHGFAIALESALQAICDVPHRWPIRNNGCREYVFPSRFPYTLVYRTGAGITVIAVAHQRRRPGYWQSR